MTQSTISDIISGLVALATATLAFFTWRLARSTSRSVKEMQEERKLTAEALTVSNRIAQAAENEARAIQEQVSAGQVQAAATQTLAAAAQAQAAEAVRDRQSRWEPLVTAQLIHVPGNKPTGVMIENFGAGPALDVVYVVVVTDPVGLKAWFLIGPLNLHSDARHEVALNQPHGIEQTSYEISDTTSVVDGVPVRRFTRRFMRAFEGDPMHQGRTTMPNELIGLDIPPAVLFDRPGALSGPVDGREEACVCRCINGHIHRSLTHLRILQEEFDPDDSTRTWLDWYKRIALAGLRVPQLQPKPEPAVIRTEPLSR